METENNTNLPDMKKLSALPLFAAMTAVGAYITIPLPWSPVPIVLQNFFVLLAGLVLGPSAGAAGIGLYLFMGLVGLPVFAGGTGGLAHFAGPTAGYLVAYPAAAWVAGFVAGGRRAAGRTSRFLREFAAAAAGVLVIYAAGVPWLKFRLGFGWEKAFLAGMLPFIASDLFKAAAAAALAPVFRKIFRGEGIGDTR